MFNKTKPVEFMIVFSLSLVALLSACVPLQIADIDPPAVEMIVQYDPAQNELPEGIALDSVGNVYVSLASLGELRQITPNGTQSVVTTWDPEEGFGLLGLAVDEADHVYAAMSSSNPEINGVYQITPAGESTRLAGSEEIVVPNAITFGPKGDRFVTDTILGAVWHIPQDGAATLWVQDALLEGTGDFGFGVPIGANGIAYYEAALYVANTEQGLIVRIPVNDDGSAGTPETLIADAELLVGADGVAFDEAGDLYVVSVSGDLLLKIEMADDPPTVTVLAEAADGLDGPASLAFGTHPETRQVIYMSNFALLSEEKNPGVVTYALNK